jgi:hypothetical protein
VVEGLPAADTERDDLRVLARRQPGPQRPPVLAALRGNPTLLDARTKVSGSRSQPSVAWFEIVTP